MAEASRSGAPVVTAALAVLCLAIRAYAGVMRIKIPGTATFFLPDSTTCSTAVNKQEFTTSLAARLQGIEAADITVDSATCASETQVVNYEIMLPPGKGPSKDQTVKRLRSFRDSDSEREAWFIALKLAGYSATKVDVEMGMWKCTETMQCESLTGFSGNIVRMTLGVNATTPTPKPVVVEEDNSCDQVFWLLKDMNDDLDCMTQIGITFGGIGAIVICCPLFCWICRRRRRALLDAICGMDDPSHLGIGDEAHAAYWWTDAAAEAEEFKSKDPPMDPLPEGGKKVTPRQVKLLLEERQKKMNEEDKEDDGTETEMAATSSMKEGKALDSLLADLQENGFITKADPEAPPPPLRESELEDNNATNNVVRAATLFEKAYTEKGASKWSPSCGLTPAYKDEIQLEFYSIRNICWLIADFSVFVLEKKEKKIVYGTELQLAETNSGSAIQWRWNVNLEQLRLPIEQGEIVETCGAGGTWLQATVEGPRLCYRQNMGHQAFRQQLAYNLRLADTKQIMKMIPAERVRRCFPVGSEIDFFDMDSGWTPGVVKADTYVSEDPGDTSREDSLQPWREGNPNGTRVSKLQSVRNSTNNTNSSNEMSNVSPAKRASKNDAWSKTKRHSVARHSLGFNMDELPQDVAKSDQMVALAAMESSRVNLWSYVFISPKDGGGDRPMASYLIRNRQDARRRASWL